VIGIGLFSWISLMVGYFLQIPETLEVMNYTIFLISIGGALLGVRKIIGTKPKE